MAEDHGIIKRKPILRFVQKIISLPSSNGVYFFTDYSHMSTDYLFAFHSKWWNFYSLTFSNSNLLPKNLTCYIFSYVILGLDIQIYLLQFWLYFVTLFCVYVKYLTHNILVEKYRVICWNYQSFSAGFIHCYPPIVWWKET